MAVFVRADARALVVLQVGDQVWLAAVLPQSVEVAQDSYTMSVLDGSSHSSPGPTYLRLEGTLYTPIRTWSSWEDFAADMGQIGVSREALPPGTLLQLGPG